MNKVIGFIKGNLIVVISIVLIFVFLPTGYVFASKWNTKIHEEASSAYNKEKRTLSSKGSINYALPAVLAGEESLTESRPPNSRVTAFYAARKAEREEQVQEVVSRGTEFNQAGHEELVPGILPQAPDDRTQKRLGREMAEAIAGTQTKPSVYHRKLQRLNAGMPPNAEALAATLEDVRDEQQKVFENSNSDGKMTPEQIKLLEERLVSHRLGEYMGRSTALTFYCSTDAFVGAKASSRAKVKYSNIPSTVPPLSTIDESVVFTWLWDFWMISDVLEATALANTDPISGAMSIPDAPIKSIEQIRVSLIEMGGQEKPDDDAGGGTFGRGRQGSQGTNDTKEETKGTFTGRTGGGPNSAFDIRMIEMTVVASSQDLPKFIDAIGKTNYMTVTDIDLEEVDVWADLDQGFFYGDDHVVRATITIESVWLRSWMSPLMPDPVKLAMGIPVAGSDEEIDD